METIKIAHLYYDLMNLYGEHGNVLALIHHLEEHKIKAIVHYLSIEDDIDFDKYDIFYIGSGNKPAFKLVLEDILKRKKDIEKVILIGRFKWDVRVRLLYAKIREEKIIMLDDLNELTHILKSETKGDIYTMVCFDMTEILLNKFKEDQNGNN